MLRIIALLLLIPLLDMVLLVAVAGVIGLVPTVLLVVLTGLVGLLLVRAEGRFTLGKIQRKLVDGDPPTDELLDGALLLVAGAFLLTPGVVTDAIGFIFVLPPTRYPVRMALKKWVVTPYLDKKTGGFATGSVYVGGFPGEGNADVSGMGADGSGVQDIGEARDVTDRADDRE
ncbi:MAG: FxsA family protein [archaeon]